MIPLSFYLYYYEGSNITSTSKTCTATRTTVCTIATFSVSHTLYGVVPAEQCSVFYIQNSP
ncbi:hypothetical protein V8C40DRAFT_232507 [Trichoderma camerunense]